MRELKVLHKAFLGTTGAFYCCSKMAGRPPCDTSAEDLSLLFHTHLGHRLTPDTFAGTCLASVHEKHASFFKALVDNTRALNMKTVIAACPDRFSAGDKKVLQGHLQTALSDLLLEKRNQHRSTPRTRLRPNGVYDLIFGASADEPAAPAEGDLPAAVDLVSEEESPEEGADPLAAHNLLDAALAAQLNEPAALQEIESSQETLHLGGAGERKPAVDFTRLPSWWDSAARKMRLEVPGSGDVVFGEVVPGPQGYLMVTWPGCQPVETQISSLAMSISAQKSQEQGSVKKKPAAAPAKKVPDEGKSPEEGAPSSVPAGSEPKRRRTEGNEEPLHGHSEMLGAIKTYMGPDKAYVQYWDEAASRWVSVANLAKAATKGRHKEFCKEMWAKLCSDPVFGQEQANELKKQMLARPL